jgi:hypothetical protein
MAGHKPPTDLHRPHFASGFDEKRFYLNEHGRQTLSLILTAVALQYPGV